MSCTGLISVVGGVATKRRGVELMYDLARYDGVWLSVTETEITAALWHTLWSIVVREELYVFSRQCHILCRHIRMTTYGLQV